MGRREAVRAKRGRVRSTLSRTAALIYPEAPPAHGRRFRPLAFVAITLLCSGALASRGFTGAIATTFFSCLILPRFLLEAGLLPARPGLPRTLDGLPVRWRLAEDQRRDQLPTLGVLSVVAGVTAFFALVFHAPHALVSVVLGATLGVVVSTTLSDSNCWRRTLYLTLRSESTPVVGLSVARSGAEWRRGKWSAAGVNEETLETVGEARAEAVEEFLEWAGMDPLRATLAATPAMTAFHRFADRSRMGHG